MEIRYLHLEKMELSGSLNLRIVREQFILCQLIAMNLWTNSSMNSQSNGKKLSPDSFELVKSSKHGQNVYTKIYTNASGKVKCKVSDLVDESRKRVPIPIRRIN